MTHTEDPTNVDVEVPDEYVAELFRTFTAVDGFTAQMRRAFAINAHERLALAALWAEGPMTMSQLGAWIPLSRAAVTTLVDRLEEAGYVRRSADANDRRRTVVTVEHSTLDTMIPIMLPWSRDMFRFTQTFESEEWAIVERFLEGMREHCIEHASKLKQLTDEEIQARAGTGT